MINFFRFIWCAIVAYRRARNTGKCCYQGVSVHGVPPSVCICGNRPGVLESDRSSYSQLQLEVLGTNSFFLGTFHRVKHARLAS